LESILAQGKVVTIWIPEEGQGNTTTSGTNLLNKNTLFFKGIFSLLDLAHYDRRCGFARSNRGTFA
jgi:hypothetical protein